MIKKLLSIVILMIIIFSSYVYGANVIVPEENNKPSEEQTTNKPDSGESSTKPENKEEDDIAGDIEDNNKDNQNNENKDTASNNNITTNKENNKKPNEGGNNKKPTTQQNQTITSNNVATKKSSEARLKQLKVDVEGLSPEFDKDTTEYYLIVDLSVNKIKVTTKALDDKATVTVTGNKSIKEGENTITINVKAEDGTVEKYNIYVTKVDNVELANAELESLKIEGFNLYPSFKSNIYSYNLNIDEEIEKLDITATPQRDKATVKIEGNTNLQEGENTIKINVTAEDKTTIRTYKIKAFINSDAVEVKEEDKMPAIILLAVLGLGVIISGIVVIVKNKR